MTRFVLSGVVVLMVLVVGCSSGSGDNGNGSTTLPTGTSGAFVDVSASEAKDLIDSMPRLIVLDVSPFYGQGHIPGAINYPMADGSLEAAIPSLDTAVPYLIYCHSDSVSIAGAQLLIDRAFSTVYRLEGNFAAWVGEDYQIGMTASVDWFADGVITSGEYTASRRLNSDYELYWRMQSENISVAMRARTDGWVAIGFDPSSRMKDADIILGFVSKAETSIIDSMGTAPIQSHPADTNEGGTSDIIEFAGSENGDATTIEFKRPLSTGDFQDNDLSVGPVKIIWAYGSNDNPSQRHSERGTSEIVLGK